MKSAVVGVVVPTLGKRIDYLVQALMSIRDAGDCVVYVVSPQPDELQTRIDPMLYDRILADPGRGLSAAIDHGLRELPVSVKYVNWLGDDDLLVPESITVARSVIEVDDSISLVFGGCQYIDDEGNELWLNKSGQWATTLMRFGPQLVSQPGALFRRDRYEEVGGLCPQFEFAFDLDLFIRISRIGKSKHIPTTLAKFRWHEDSLTVRGRSRSVAEASAIRIAALPRLVSLFSFVWEVPLRVLIWRIGGLVKHL